MCVKYVDRTIVLHSGRSDQINNQCAVWSPFAIHMPSNSWSQTCFVLQLCEERVQSWVITRFGIHAIHLVSGLLILNQSSILLRFRTVLGKPVQCPYKYCSFLKHCWKSCWPPIPLGFEHSGCNLFVDFKKNPSEMEVAPCYMLLTLLNCEPCCHCWHCWHCIYYSNCFTLLKQ